MHGSMHGKFLRIVDFYKVLTATMAATLQQCNATFEQLSRQQLFALKRCLF
jgi:hypothetical protein